MEMIERYWKIIMSDALLSSLMASVAFIVVTFIFRWAIFRQVKIASRQISKKNYHILCQHYVKQSLSGWIFYFLALGGFVAFWYRSIYLAITLKESALLLVGSLVIFLISLLFHFAAFAKAGLQTIRKQEDQQLKA